MIISVFKRTHEKFAFSWSTQYFSSLQFCQNHRFVNHQFYLNALLFKIKLCYLFLITLNLCRPSFWHCGLSHFYSFLEFKEEFAQDLPTWSGYFLLPSLGIWYKEEETYSILSAHFQRYMCMWPISTRKWIQNHGHQSIAV